MYYIINTQYQPFKIKSKYNVFVRNRKSKITQIGKGKKIFFINYIRSSLRRECFSNARVKMHFVVFFIFYKHAYVIQLSQKNQACRRHYDSNLNHTLRFYLKLIVLALKNCLTRHDEYDIVYLCSEI